MSSSNYSGRAADLPEGSVVKVGMTEWTKYQVVTDPDRSAWETDMKDRRPDWYIDRLLANGALVLRVGTGLEG